MLDSFNILYNLLDSYDILNHLLDSFNNNFDTAPPLGQREKSSSPRNKKKLVE